MKAALIAALRWLWIHTEVTPQGVTLRAGRLALSWAAAGMRPAGGFAAREGA